MNSDPQTTLGLDQVVRPLCVYRDTLTTPRTTRIVDHTATSGTGDLNISKVKTGTKISQESKVLCIT
jgi:hypothetical protein